MGSLLPEAVREGLRLRIMPSQERNYGLRVTMVRMGNVMGIVLLRWMQMAMYLSQLQVSVVNQVIVLP